PPVCSGRSPALTPRERTPHAVESMRQLLLVITLLLAATPVSGQIADSLRLRPGDPVRFPGPLPGQATLVDGTVVSVLPHAFEFSVRGASGQTYTRSYDTLTSIDVG